MYRSYAPAATSVGTARKKENSVAARRDSPNSNPPMMVAPEREVPGISAKHCATPTFSASSQVMSSTDSTRTTCRRRSAHRITSAPTIKAMATGTGRNRVALMKPPNSNPNTAAGTKAMLTLSTNRCAARSESSPVSALANLARYSHTTDSMAPV